MIILHRLSGGHSGFTETCNFQPINAHGTWYPIFRQLRLLGLGEAQQPTQPITRIAINLLGSGDRGRCVIKAMGNTRVTVYSDVSDL